MEVLMGECIYNELEQAAEKKIHSTNNGNTFQQQVDYAYNLKGWLTTINDPDSLGSGLFGMELKYDDVSEITGFDEHIRYNGNLAGVQWKNIQVATKKAYAFGYDGLNRLTDADYGEGTSSIADQPNKYNVYGITYDENGNIATLKRDGASGCIDNLAYYYFPNTNRLSIVEESTGGDPGKGFVDVVLDDDDFEYDANGNMVRDENKGISLAYNQLGKISEAVHDATSGTYHLVYDAAGNLLARGNDHDGIFTHYIGGFVYTYSGSNYADLECILTPEGRITIPDGNCIYEYHLKDHQGNTRVAFDATAAGPVVKQATDYYPFGMLHEPVALNNDNDYLYSGKEFFEENGINLYNYGATLYGAQLGRWHTLDPRFFKAKQGIPCGNE